MEISKARKSWFARVRLFLRRPKKAWLEPPPKTGVEFICGLPGAGKSYMVVSRLIQSAIRERRPVYTNLPLKWRSIRKYIAIVGGDSRLVNYIEPLTRDHMHRAMLRAVEFVEWREVRKAAGLSSTDEDFFSSPKLETAGIDSDGVAMIETRGPHITSGPNANWIPENALVVVDEAHYWFPTKWDGYNGLKDEPGQYMKYASMHRHFLHWIWLITQEQMNVALSWRRFAGAYVFAADKSKLNFIFTFKLPLKIFGFASFPGLFFSDGRMDPRAKPDKEWTLIPAIDGKTNFRLYSSHTHAGSARSLRRKLANVRAKLDGEPQPERDKALAEAAARNKRVNKIVAAVFAVLALLALAVYGMGRKHEETDKNVVLADLNQKLEKEREELKKSKAAATQPSGKGGAAAAVAVPAVPKLTAIGPAFVMVRNQRVPLGGRFEGMVLLEVDIKNRDSTWIGPACRMGWALGGEPRVLYWLPGGQPDASGAVRAQSGNPAGPRPARRVGDRSSLGPSPGRGPGG